MAETADGLGELLNRGYRFALSLTHDPPRAEDLTQDAWFSMLRANAPRSREYMFSTIRNRFIDQYRRDRLLRFEPIVDDPDDRETSDRGPGHADGEDYADSVFAVNGTLQSALGQLRAEERAVLFLSAVEDYTAQQIADLLTWPRGTVLSMLHRTRRKVRRMLEAQTGTKT